MGYICTYLVTFVIAHQQFSSFNSICQFWHTRWLSPNRLWDSVFFTKPVVGCMNFTSPLVITLIHTLTKWMKCTQAGLSTIWGSYHHSWLLYNGTNLPCIQNRLCHSSATLFLPPVVRECDRSQANFLAVALLGRSLVSRNCAAPKLIAMATTTMATQSHKVSDECSARNRPVSLTKCHYFATNFARQ